MEVSTFKCQILKESVVEKTSPIQITFAMLYYTCIERVPHPTVKSMAFALGRSKLGRSIGVLRGAAGCWGPPRVSEERKSGAAELGRASERSRNKG